MNIKIDHIAMYVRDLEGMRDFYTQWFGAVSNEGYHSATTGMRSYFLTFANGVRLELMNWSTVAENEPCIEKYGLTHLALQVDGPVVVDSLTTQMENAGYRVVSGPRTTGDGYYESCVLDPEGNRIEITG